MKIILLTLLFAMISMTGFAQSGEDSIPFLNYNNYDQYTEQSEIVVVEFWAKWNSDNAYPLQELRNTKIYRVNIDSESNLVHELEIEVVPTIFIYKNGQLMHVDESDVSFKRKKEIEHLQEEINNLL